MKAWISEAKKHVLSLLSSEAGSLSSSRLLMLVFSAFALIALSAIGWHLLHVRSPEELHEWLNALPSIFGGLAALIGVPYSVSRAASSVSDIIASLRKQG